MPSTTLFHADNVSCRYFDFVLMILIISMIDDSIRWMEYDDQLYFNYSFQDYYNIRSSYFWSDYHFIFQSLGDSSYRLSCRLYFIYHVNYHVDDDPFLTIDLYMMTHFIMIIDLHIWCFDDDLHSMFMNISYWWSCIRSCMYNLASDTMIIIIYSIISLSNS